MSYETLECQGIEVVVFESTLAEEEFFHNKAINDFEEFTHISDVVVSNRFSVVHIVLMYLMLMEDSHLNALLKERGSLVILRTDTDGILYYRDLFDFT